LLLDPEYHTTVLPSGEVVDAVLGYRMWRVRGERGRLRLTSVYWLGPDEDEEWAPKIPFRAVCKCPEYVTDTHTCGVHAWASPARPVFTLGGGRIIFGEVALWGEVRVHELGYRADSALPLALYLRPGASDGYNAGVELAALQYDLPVVRT
jgi:hypothetical protein